jgi:hypothetical protein
MTAVLLNGASSPFGPVTQRIGTGLSFVIFR